MVEERLKFVDRAIFGDLVVGIKFRLDGAEFVKMTYVYHLIGGKMYNSINTSSGELMYISDGMCVGLCGVSAEFHAQSDPAWLVQKVARSMKLIHL